MCLNMIVKDESHIIERTLHMLCSKIRFDYWVICDTGSTDNTREIIVQFFKEKNIPGELHCDEWVDFGHNRSLALERAFNKTDLLLVFDADDEIHGTIPIPNEILFDEYQLAFGEPKSGMNYTRTQIINNHKRFKYLSVLHEFISCQEPEPARVCILNGDYYLISGRTGARNKDPNKYLKDAVILEKAHAVALAKGDDLHKRYAFYCANSYRDCGRHEDAIKWYKITLSQDNWEQEKYVSCLYIYHCYEALKQPDCGFFYLVKAFSYDSSRVECLYPLVIHYCCENMNEMAYNYFRMVKMTTPQNNAGKLFVETDKAGFYVPYYMIIVADRVKDYECGIRMYEHIFKEKHRTFSPWHLRNLIFNLRFFINHVKPDALNAFVELANSYLKFVIDNGVPVNTFQDLSINLTSTGSIETTLTNKIKAKSSFKTSQNVLVYTGYCNVHWNYTKMKHGALGGSEKAVAHLTKELGIMLGREKGMQIYVAGDVQPENLAEEFNVVYVSLNELPELLSKLHFHTVVCSRYISFLELYGNACSFYQFYIWAHDTSLLSYGCNLSDTAIIEKWADCIDGCVCQTQWHAERYIELYPSLKTKMQTINNGIDLELFPPSVSKEAGKFVYTSRTERGLARVLDLWPEVVAAVPNAALTVSTYEAFPCNDEERRIQDRIESLNQEFPNNRIQHAGKLNPTELYAQLSTAEYWLYPTNWPETSCITAMEMLMSGVICLYYPLAGLKDTMNGHGLQIAPGSEIKTLREIAHDETRKDMLRKQGRAYAESCSWAIRANSWKQIIFQKRIAIFNSFPFHYEMFGHILDHFSRKCRNDNASTIVSIFTETRNNLGWLEFYEKQFKHVKFQYKPIAEFCDARHAFDLIFVPTDDDFAFKREWIDERCIANDHHVSIRRPEYAHRIGVRPFAGSDKQWALPCCEFISANEKLRHLEPDCIHIAIGGGLQCILNYDAINRLSASLPLPLHLHFIGRKIIELRSKIKDDIVIHLHEKVETNEMIELLKKCDYIMTDLQNDDHINGISMSGSVPLAFSTLATLIISKQNNRIYGFKNAVEFDLNSDEPIILSKTGGTHIEQLQSERELLIRMYDNAIEKIIEESLKKTPKKIVDCFIFYNELNMLAYRLHALNSVVDHFVIVEARQTFIGASKPLYFGENKHEPRFAQYADKIIHVVVDLPYQGNIDISQNQQWANEHFQRNCISRGIDELTSRLNERDIIIVADVDEVPDPTTLAKIKEECVSLNKVMSLEQDFYYYNLKCKHNAKWHSCKALTFKAYKDMNASFETIRHLQCEKIANGGWHMSYFGDAKFIKNKVENFSHQEHNLKHITDVEEIQKKIDEGIDLYMRPGETFEHIAICNNNYLPPDYQTHLSAFF
jgi:beta-1,4-mannosyl-glycoprotein beta-1,4-N-acetylglucosaminyltransferase